MQFLYWGTNIVLKWLKQFTLLEESSSLKLGDLEEKGVLLQLMEKQREALESPQAIQTLLFTYQSVFVEPKGLSPNRSHDHFIHLRPESKVVYVRPYRYHYFQKQEIEKIVKELLHNGVICRSQSPYSSPVLLVRKVDGSQKNFLMNCVVLKFTLSQIYNLVITKFGFEIRKFLRQLLGFMRVTKNFQLWLLV